MIYDVNSLLSVLRLCDGKETVYIQTPSESFIITGYDIDEDGDVILSTGKIGD